MAFSASLSRSVKLAKDNLLRNKFMSLATVLIMALILFILNIILSINLLAQQAIQDLEQKVDLILYLNDEADALVVNQLIQELDAFPETESVTYTSKDEALESLVDKYGEAVNPFTTYDLDNPLPASIQVITEDPSDHETVLTYLEQSNYAGLLLEVESHAENEAIVSNLSEIIEFTQKLLLGVIVTFILGSAMIIGNTIHVTIFNRKREIQIMRLVGSHLNFIRSPFLIEGAFYALGSVLLSFALFMAFAQTLKISNVSFLSGEIHFGKIVVSQLIASLILGMSSSLTAINRHLKKNLL